MSRPTMQRPQKETNGADKLMEKINAVSSKQADRKITGLPRVRYPTKLGDLATCVLAAFMTHATQPTFKVLSVRPNEWRVDAFHLPGEERFQFREFAPCVRSMKMKQRMYHQATFANVRLVANSIMAAVLEELVVHRRSKSDHEEIVVDGTTCKLKVFLAPCSDTERWNTQVRLICGDDETREVQALDNGKGVHLTTWCYLNGGGYAEVDLTARGGITVERHAEAPPAAKRLLPETALSQARVAMSKREEGASVDETLDEIAKHIEDQQVEMKKERQRERRRRREKRKKEQKRLARAAAAAQQVENAP